MIYLRSIGIAAILTSLLLVPNAALAFWFLPGFTASNADEARQTALLQGAAGSGQVAETTDPSPTLDESPPLRNEGAPTAGTTTDTSAGLAIPESQDNLAALPSAVENLPPIPEAEPVETIVQMQPPQIVASPLDFDLESLALYQVRPEPAHAANPLSSQEMDLVLSNRSFDVTYDLSDGAIQPALSTFPLSVFLEVEAGDTLSKMFQDVGISITETGQAATALSENYNLGNLRPGQVLELELNGAVEPFGTNRLQCLFLSPSSLVRIEVCRTVEGFSSNRSEIELNRALVFAAGPLRSGSVYLDGDAMNIESQVIANYVNALDSQLNFSRIQSVGDEIEMIYEAYFDDDGRLVEVGDVLYAAFKDQNQETYEAFRFENDGKTAYFTRDARFTGQTNTLMRKPVGGGRLSSRFGMRTHPVYGDRRMHNGVDYAASCGTPIYASGDGTVQFAGWKGGYGRFIAIKHGSTYTTNYAHMRSFANGMRPGVRVRKGQLIGRVGTTGASTGCHLHYEVVKNGRHINPLSDHIPRGSDLTSAAKTRFLAFVSQLDTERENGVTFEQALARAQAGIY